MNRKRPPPGTGRDDEPRFDPHELYSVGHEGGGVGGMVRLIDKGTAIRWVMPEGRERVYVISKRLPARRGIVFAFVDSEGRTFELRVLTVRLYNERVRLPGQPTYRTQAELHAAYWLSLGYWTPPMDE